MNLQNLKITTSISGSQTNAKDLTTPQADIVESFVQSYTDGTGADQAQLIFADTRTLSGSGAESLDLAGGLTHELGGTITFTAIKEIILVPAAANAGNIRLGRVVTNGFAGPFDQTAGSLGVVATPDGIIHLRNSSATGWAVTAATADLLRVENLDAAAVTYDIIIVGEGTVA